jgi:hypothetical protein
MIWEKSTIRVARKCALTTVLAKRGYSLRKLENGNVLVDDLGSVVVKESFWYDRIEKIGGNAIDFFVRFEKKSFSEAMEILVPKNQGGKIGSTRS